MQFLGHVMSDLGIFVDLAKIEVVTSWEQPKTVSDVHLKFLGTGRLLLLIHPGLFDDSCTHDSVDSEGDLIHLDGWVSQYFRS